jgi:signal transduction histidine kinase
MAGRSREMHPAMEPLMIDGWTLGFLANGVIATAFLAVAVLLAVNLTTSKQWRKNPLAAATVFLFITCGGGHAIYTLQLIEGSLGFDTASGAAIRYAYGEPHMWVWDGVIAVTGVAYWRMRSRFPALVTGTAVFEDLRERQAQALEIHDNVVQGLVRAKLALELDDREQGDEAVDAALASAQRIVTDLLSQESTRAHRAPPGGGGVEPATGGG